MNQASDSIRYALPEEMHMFEREDRFLFFDPRNFIWFQTDQLGKRVVDGLLERGSIDDAALALSIFAQAPLEDARDFASRTIDKMLEIGFLHEGEYVLDDWKSQGPSGNPFILYLHMTSACNLRCPYCYNQEHRHQILREKIGSFDQYARVLDEAAELGFRQIKVTGGEPLLNRNTLPLIRHAKSCGLWVNLLTNGTLVDEENAAEIARFVDAVSLSLDSPHPEEHDVVRGEGTWKQVLRAIRLLRGEGLKTLHLNSVINNINRKSVKGFLEYAWDELKAEQVTVSQTGFDVEDPSGRWGAKETMLDMQGVWDVFDAQIAYRKQKGQTRDAVAPRIQCGAGNGLVSIDSNGDLYPCQTMHRPELLCGNVFETSLRQVIEESPLLKNVRDMTVDRLEDCPTCPMRYICSGGCRMEAYTRENRLTARNRDMCPVFFQRALDKLWGSAYIPAGQKRQAQDPVSASFMDTYQ